MAGGSVCKSCGSLLPLPDSEGHVSCMSCGRTERASVKEPAPDAESAASPGTVFVSWTPGSEDAGGGVRKGSSNSSGRRGVGCIVAVIVIAVVVPIVAALVGVFATTSAVKEAFDDVGSPVVTRSRLSSAGYQVVELPVTDGAGVEVITGAYDGSTNSRLIARVALGGDGEVRWQSEAFPSGVNDSRLVLSGRTLFAAVGKELWALVAETGAVSWKAPLSDAVKPACESCFSALGDGVVVSTADGQVFSYGPDSAQPRWGHRLVSTGSSLLVSDTEVVVVDDIPERSGRKQVVVLDATSGTVASSFAPQCNDGSMVWEFNFTDEVYAVEGSADLVATVSTGGGCMVRWNGTTGAVAWSVNIDLSGARGRGLLIADRLYLGHETGITSVDLTSGAAVQLAAPTDTTASALLRNGDLLVCETASTRGSAKAGLAAYDMASGQLRWSFELPGGGELLPLDADTSDALFDDTGRSVVFDADDKLMVATFAGVSRTVTTRSVDLQTGVLGEAAVVQLPKQSGTPSVSIISANAGGLLFKIDQKIVRLPLGGEPTMWPQE